MVNRLPFKGFVLILVLVATLLLAAPAAAAPASGPMHTSVHVVHPGETLYSIARAYGVSPYQIAMANHLVNPNLIYSGQRLVVPGGYGPQPYPRPSGQVYTVKPGDTLFSIAARFGTTVNALAMANNISNPNLLFAGQQLVIPSGSAGYPPSHPPVKVVKKVVVVEKKPAPKPLRPALCNDRTQITFPRRGETLDGIGTFSVTGTANIEDFQFYKLELGVGKSPIEFHSITDDVFRKSIVNGILYRDWNTGALPEGTYTLRLTVVDNSGQFPPPCDVIIHIDH